MNRFIFSILTILSFSFSASSYAEANSQPSMGTGKLVIYRDKSKQATAFTVFTNTTKIGRIREGRAVTIELPAGTHTLSTNVRGSNKLNVTVDAGQTIFINSALVKKRSGKYRTTLEMVSEQVALSSAPLNSDMI